MDGAVDLVTGHELRFSLRHGVPIGVRCLCGFIPRGIGIDSEDAMAAHLAMVNFLPDLDLFSRSTVRSGRGSASGEVKGTVTMKLHKASHLDHHLTAAQLAHVLLRFDGRAAFFIETIELPAELGTVPCGLHGPIMGDPPVPETEVTHARRGERAWTSRLVGRPARPTRQLTIIAGPHEETCPTCKGSGLQPVHGLGSSIGCDHCAGSGKLSHPCILYTVFGGPAAPQEPGDPGCKDPEASERFWRDHGLSK